MLYNGYTVLQNFYACPGLNHVPKDGQGSVLRCAVGPGHLARLSPPLHPMAAQRADRGGRPAAAPLQGRVRPSL